MHPRVMRRHRVHDYRFSEQAVLEGGVRVQPVMFPPRIFGHGYKRRPPKPPPTLRARAVRKARRVAARVR